VRLTIRDTGAGMDEAIQIHIFEPFFRSSSGGLGLAAAYGITDQHGGCIVVESIPDGGTAFTVYLPSLHRRAPPRCSPAADGAE
jgi:signal transduction histidine kinase